MKASAPTTVSKVPSRLDMEPEAGIEPATPRLRIVCSAKLSYSGAVLMILA